MYCDEVLREGRSLLAYIEVGKEAFRGGSGFELDRLCSFGHSLPTS